MIFFVQYLMCVASSLWTFSSMSVHSTGTRSVLLTLLLSMLLSDDFLYHAVCT